MLLCAEVLLFAWNVIAFLITVTMLSSYHSNLEIKVHSHNLKKKMVDNVNFNCIQEPYHSICTSLKQP